MARHRRSQVRYRTLLGNREFAGLVGAQLTSEVGDQIARVALALLVLERTGSVFGAAATFAIGYVPAVFGAALLGPLADRVSRRAVLLGADAARALVLLAMALLALAGAPLWSLFALLVAAELFTAPFDAARTASIPDVLPEPARTAAATGLMRSVSLVTQVLGLLLGGVVVHALGSPAALFVDAGTFVASFLVIWATMRRRPPAADGQASLPRLLGDLRDGAVLLARDPVRRWMVGTAWATSLVLIAPEAVALGYAASLGAGDVWGAGLMASVLAGAAVGAFLLARRRIRTQAVLLLPLALTTFALLALTWLSTGVWATAVLWALAGATQAFLVPLMSFTNLLTEPGQRGRVAGLAAAGFSLASAVGFLVAGWLADVTGPSTAVVAFGVVGVVVVLLSAAARPGAPWLARVRDLETGADPVQVGAPVRD